MRLNFIKGLTYSFLLALSALLFSCSAQKTTTISKAFHNTTSHYNAYYYARENIRAVENILDNNRKNDFDEILPIFPKIDSTIANTYEAEIEEAIKMASLAIQRHPNSKWVDDSYLLIGLARYYSLDFVNAIQTFKYINTNSEDDDVRHKALIYLLRTFTDYGEYDNAVAVSDFLKKEKLSNTNEKLLYIYQAYYYQVRDDLDNMLGNLVNAAPILSRKDGRGRMYFIIGQNYQELGFGPEAYYYYRKCIATNPEYELDFYARLNMAQVVQIENSSDIKNARKSFEKLLTDKKNKEFKDKIYYEMAEFEMRQDNMDLAIDYYNSSVRSSTVNNKQKGISYLKLGRIYYDSLSQYRAAEAYYDSSLSVLPRNYEDYASIKERADILTDFVNQLNTIQIQDSLLSLSLMDSVSLWALLSEHVEEEQAKKEELEKRKREAERRQSANVFATGPETQSASWYFGNPTAVAMGKTDFQRVWGDIVLEDNWRRSFKDETLAEVPDGTTPNGPGVINQNGADEGVPEGEFSVENEVRQLIRTIPYTSQAKEMAHNQIEDAYYRLGNIYHFNLYEDVNAASSFETLLSRYDTTAYKTEVMYLLYLIYNQLGREAQANVYKNKLLTDYPNTTYARLILNPNYTKESSAAAENLKVLYDSAYEYFQIDSFALSKQVIAEALSEYDDLQISTRFKLLQVLITGETEDIAQYQYELSEFIKNNPDSDLAPYADDLLQASRTFQQNQLKAQGIRFVEYFEQEHYVIIVYNPNRPRITDELSQLIDQFNRENFPGDKLRTSNLILTDKYFLTMVSEFPGQPTSTSYFQQLKEWGPLKNMLKTSDYDIYAITKDNFTIFYQNREIDGYKKFFNEHYN